MSFTWLARSPAVGLQRACTLMHLHATSTRPDACTLVMLSWHPSRIMAFCTISLLFIFAFMGCKSPSMRACLSAAQLNLGQFSSSKSVIP